MLDYNFKEAYIKLATHENKALLSITGKEVVYTRFGERNQRM